MDAERIKALCIFLAILAGVAIATYYATFFFLVRFYDGKFFGAYLLVLFILISCWIISSMTSWIEK